MEVLDVGRSKKASETAERLGISYRVDSKNEHFTDPFIAKLTETTYDLARNGLRPANDGFIARLLLGSSGRNRSARALSFMPRRDRLRPNRSFTRALSWVRFRHDWHRHSTQCA